MSVISLGRVGANREEVIMRMNLDTIGDWCGIVGLILMAVGVGLYVILQIIKLIG